MARTDVLVLGAGIVGTSIALQLAKRGLSVALLDRLGRVGEETSYGNAGVIEGNTLFPPAFPGRFSALLRVALKRAPEANYHFCSCRTSPDGWRPFAPRPHPIASLRPRGSCVRCSRKPCRSTRR